MIAGGKFVTFIASDGLMDAGVICVTPEMFASSLHQIEAEAQAYRFGVDTTDQAPQPFRVERDCHDMIEVRAYLRDLDDPSV